MQRITLIHKAFQRGTQQLQFMFRRWQQHRLADGWSRWRQVVLQIRRQHDAASALTRALSGWWRAKTRACMQRWKLRTTQLSAKRVHQRLMGEITRKQSQLQTLKSEHREQLSTLHTRFATEFNTMCSKYDSTILTIESRLMRGTKHSPTLKQIALRKLLRRMAHARLSHAFTVWSNFRPCSVVSTHLEKSLEHATKTGTLLPFKVLSEHLCRDTLQAVQSSFASAISDAKTTPQ